jgi:hypothetical protein
MWTMFKLHRSTVYPLMPFFVVPQFFHSSQTTPSSECEAEQDTCITDTHNWSSSWPWRISPITTVIEPPCSKLMCYVPPNFTNFVAGSFWILKIFSSQKCTRYFWKFLYIKHTIFSCIPPCLVSSCVCFFKLFSYFKV